MNKKEIIKKVVDQMRMGFNFTGMTDVKMITRVLTEDEEKLRNKPNELVALVETKNIEKNNRRLDEILKINGIE